MADLDPRAVAELLVGLLDEFRVERTARDVCRLVRRVSRDACELRPKELRSRALEGLRRLEARGILTSSKTGWPPIRVWRRAPLPP